MWDFVPPMSPAMSMVGWFLLLREPLRREKLRHLEDVPVIVALNQRICRFLVDDKGYVGMHLQSGSADRGSDGTLDGFGDSCGFGAAGGEKKQTLGVHNRADAHGDGAFGHIRFAGENVTVVFNSFTAKGFQSRSRSQTRCWLIETDMAVAADAKNLQVDTAGSFD